MAAVDDEDVDPNLYTVGLAAGPVLRGDDSSFHPVAARGTGRAALPWEPSRGCRCPDLPPPLVSSRAAIPWTLTSTSASHESSCCIATDPLALVHCADADAESTGRRKGNGKDDTADAAMRAMDGDHRWLFFLLCLSVCLHSAASSLVEHACTNAHRKREEKQGGEEKK